MAKKIILIDGRRAEVILPKGMKASDVPNEIRLKKETVNVGIRKDQKERIMKVIDRSRSVNSFVQEAVEDKLFVLVGMSE